MSIQPEADQQPGSVVILSPVRAEKSAIVTTNFTCFLVQGEPFILLNPIHLQAEAVNRYAHSTRL